MDVLKNTFSTRDCITSDLMGHSDLKLLLNDAPEFIYTEKLQSTVQSLSRVNYWQTQTSPRKECSTTEVTSGARVHVSSVQYSLAACYFLNITTATHGSFIMNSVYGPLGSLPEDQSDVGTFTVPSLYHWCRGGHVGKNE
ncbi:hypothetical protein E2C01_058448 [Portunus trituberculatus]|uniref:Uncharacterized protein n=1 Tax=Portunus trituberculatus TaxID=210409 RepID=A0A5B7H3R8_PORTR|nr:hypothetical protein [Portunus trituberculatus]